MMVENCEYLLVKRGLYYRPEAMGYTGLKAEAGRYPEDYALGLASVTTIHESEAPEYSPACWDETKIADLQAKLDKAVEALQEVDDTLAKLSGSLAELDAALLAQEIAVIALERENIAPLITVKPERDE